jgi:hypothetical protein
MGDQNQILFGLQHRHLLCPPFLEVGSRDYGNTATFRQRLPHAAGDYVGVDVRAGQGVDRVVDLTAPAPEVERVLPERFRTIFCLSVLEHCRDPFQMARNLQRRLSPGGHLYVSVPFAWRIHNYPADYWRFTPDGVKTLFGGLRFPDEWSAYHSTALGAFRPARDPEPKIEFWYASTRERYGRFQAFCLAATRRLGLLRPVFQHDYVFPPVQLDMIGQCPEGE